MSILQKGDRARYPRWSLRMTGSRILRATRIVKNNHNTASWPSQRDGSTFWFVELPSKDSPM
jgi:hypothetical protein